MRPSQHRAIRRQQSLSLVIEVLVGDDIVGETFVLQPGEDMAVGNEMPCAGATRVIECQEPRPHCQNWAQAR